MKTSEAYPLSWPITWPRTNPSQITTSRFRTSGRMAERSWHPGKQHSMAKVREHALKQLKLLGSSRVVISTNVELRLDGLPYANRRRPQDCGVALYFLLARKDTVLACDSWNRVECNLWAIAKHIEAMRGQERWGVGNIKQAFRGYMRLEASGHRAWRTVLDFLRGYKPSESDLKTRFRYLAKILHSDRGGDDTRMSDLNVAYADAKLELGY